MTFLRRAASARVWVLIFMPFSAGVVQDAGNPFLPSISTRHRRQDPKGSRLSVAQSFGIAMPASRAARKIGVPSGTAVGTPSISIETMLVDRPGGVPRSACRTGFKRWFIALLLAAQSRPQNV